MIHIFVEHKSARLCYVFKFIFHEVWNQEYYLVTDIQEFKELQGIKLNYSNIIIAQIPIIKAHGILQEKDIHNLSPKCGLLGKLPVLFPSETDDFFSFDIFSAIFFMLSRYEEYHNKHLDQFGRFQSKSTTAAKHMFLDMPIIDLWLTAFFKAFIQIYPNLSLPITESKFQPTYDIDNAWAYKNKSFFRSSGAFVNSIIQLNLKEVLERLKVHVGLRKDPYDTYDLIHQFNFKTKSKPVYFILLGDYAEFDKNVHYRNQEFRGLIRKLSKTAHIGLHPSFASYGEKEKLNLEKDRLEEIIEKKITSSRQHFLRISWPETYRNLINLGIRDDYSMGFSDVISFRAGTSRNFYWFDLKADKETELKIHPFSVMDNVFSFGKMDTEYVDKEIEKLLRLIINSRGNLSTLWHNEAFNSNSIRGKSADIYYKLAERFFEIRNE